MADGASGWHEARSVEVAVDRIRRDGRAVRPGRIVALVVAGAVAIVGVGAAGRVTAPTPVAPPAIPPSPVAPVAAASEGPQVSTPGPLLHSTQLPKLGSEPLPHAPVLGLWRRDADDVVTLAWDPADPESGTVVQDTIPGLLAGINADADVVVTRSPSGRFVLATALMIHGGEDDVATVRVASLDGQVVWQRAIRASTLAAPAWDAVADTVVVPVPDRWLVVALDADGRPAEHDVPVPTPGSVGPVGAFPRPVVPRIAGFSPDGRTVYAAAVDDPLGFGLRPLFAVDLPDGPAREISRLPTSLADESGAGGSADLTLPDPMSGRVIGLSPSGGSSLRVLARDGRTIAATIRRPQILGAAWTPARLLAVLSTDPKAGPGEETRLELFAGDGSAVRTPLTARLVDGGSLIAAPDAFVLLLFGSERAAELAAVRLWDGATATLILPRDELAGLRFLGWLPPTD